MELKPIFLILMPAYGALTLSPLTQTRLLAGKHLQNLQDEAVAVGTEDKSKIFLLNYQLCS